MFKDVFKHYCFYFIESLMSGISFCPKPLVGTAGLKGRGMEGKGKVRDFSTQGLTPVHPYLFYRKMSGIGTDKFWKIQQK